MQKTFLMFLILIFADAYSQKKTLQTKFTNNKIIIDGKFDEVDWQTAPIAKDFLELSPKNGGPIPENKKTEVRVLYNNDAIYIAAVMNDENSSKILRELGKRDEIGTSDFFYSFYKWQ